jgi:hypothetical protein
MNAAKPPNSGSHGASVATPAQPMTTKLRREYNGWPQYIVDVPRNFTVDERGFVRLPKRGVRGRVLLIIEETGDA